MVTKTVEGVLRIECVVDDAGATETWTFNGQVLKSQTWDFTDTWSRAETLAKLDEQDSTKELFDLLKELIR